jgi:hypothetical protein
MSRLLQISKAIPLIGIAIAIPANFHIRNQYFTSEIIKGLSDVNKDKNVSISYNDIPGFPLFDKLNIIAAAATLPITTGDRYRYRHRFSHRYRHKYKYSSSSEYPFTEASITDNNNNNTYKLEIDQSSSTIVIKEMK